MSLVASIILCISLYTGLPAAALPRGGIIHVPTHGAWAFYIPHTETIVIGAPDPDHWLLAHEITKHLQARAGVPFNERRAWDAARHWVRECR